MTLLNTLRLLAALALGSTLVACDSQIESVDCAALCRDQHRCVDPELDVEACAAQCSARVEKNDEVAAMATACEKCQAARSCDEMRECETCDMVGG